MAKTVLLAFFSILLVVTIILRPDAAFQSSLQGLTVWWNIVFPGLLPFLVLFELIAAFGLAHAISSLLQPLMSKLFKLPGEAALAIVLGWLSGFPAGAEAVASLRKRSIVTKKQGQRLLALAHMPNPLFMLVIIGAGFMHKPILGIIIAAVVWLSALWIMLLMGLLSRHSADEEITNSQTPAISGNSPSNQGILKRAAEALQFGQEQDGRSFGKALGDAVSSSVQKLMMIGGFMIFASVLAKLVEPLLAPVLSKAGIGFVTQALFEGHLGAYAAAIWDAPGNSMIINAAAIAAVLAWSGLSGILQTGYAITGTDLKLLPFVAMRLIHSLHAFAFMLILWKPITLLLSLLLGSNSVPTTLPIATNSPDTILVRIIRNADMPLLWPFSIAGCILLALALLLFSLTLLPYRRAGRSV